MKKGFLIMALWLAVEAAFVLSLAAPAAPRPPAPGAQVCGTEPRANEELVVTGVRHRARLANAP
jgi:hypothetical protein